MTKLGRVPIFIAFLLLRFTLALSTLQCEDLSIEDCAFAVSSKGARCVLEKSTLPNGERTAECQTSFIMAEKPFEWIETDECIKSCGLERNSYGLSTDALMEKGFTAKLCSAECQNNCPNIVDLYIKLAAGEGVYLPYLCSSQKSRSRRLIADPVQVARTVTTSESKIEVGSEAWSQIQAAAAAAGPLESAAFSTTSLFKPNLQASAAGAPAPLPAVSFSTQSEVTHAAPAPSPPPSPPVVPTTVTTTVTQLSVEDVENDFDADDY